MSGKKHYNIRNCPFCGKEPTFCSITDVVDEYDHCYEIRCHHCGIELGDEYESEVLKTWNTRVDVPTSRENDADEIFDVDLLDGNDAEVKTVGELFRKLLLKVWTEKDEFDGKRPFGNSDWEFEVYEALEEAGIGEDNDDRDKLVRLALERW